jgi:hypothetical protein
MPFKGKNVLTVGCQSYAKKSILQVQSGIPNMGGGQMAQEGIGIEDCGVEVLDPLIYFP